MFYVEVRGGDGGEDAASFAEQLTLSIFAHCMNKHLKVQQTDYNVLAVEAPKGCV